MRLIPRFGDVVVVNDDTERAVEIEIEIEVGVGAGLRLTV